MTEPVRPSLRPEDVVDKDRAVRVVIAPDSMGGLLPASAVAASLAEGWRAVRPDDEVVVLPMSDGGEGLLDVLHGGEDVAHEVEVCGPLGHPVDAWFSVADGGRTAIVESALACGLARLDGRDPDPLRATTWGVGELLDAAREAGVERIVLGLGGSASVDGGAGALSGLGYRVTVADGSGLKIGGEDLGRATGIAPGWRDAGWAEVEVLLLADVDAVLADAAPVFGPQKGADAHVVDLLAGALATWADVVERDLGPPGLRDRAGTGAAGGLGLGLAAALGAGLVPGARWVADRIGLDEALDGADLVLTGEGRLDDTSFAGKVVGEVAARAGRLGVPVEVVAGQDARSASSSDRVLAVHEVPATGAEEAAEAVRAAAEATAAARGA